MLLLATLYLCEVRAAIWSRDDGQHQVTPLEISMDGPVPQEETESTFKANRYRLEDCKLFRAAFSAWLVGRWNCEFVSPSCIINNVDLCWCDFFCVICRLFKRQSPENFNSIGYTARLRNDHHLHGLVHWTGYPSEVLFMLTRNTVAGFVSESWLWRWVLERMSGGEGVRVSEC